MMLMMFEPMPMMMMLLEPMLMMMFEPMLMMMTLESSLLKLVQMLFFVADPFEYEEPRDEIFVIDYTDL